MSGTRSTKNKHLCAESNAPNCIFTIAPKYYQQGQIQSIDFNHNADFLDEILPSLSTRCSFLIYLIKYWLNIFLFWRKISISYIPSTVFLSIWYSTFMLDMVPRTFFPQDNLALWLNSVLWIRPCGEYLGALDLALQPRPSSWGKTD